MLTLSAALPELRSRPPRSAFTRPYGSETGTRIVWAGSRLEMENSKGEGVTWYLSADDVLSEWVVLEATKQPEFVTGGPASRTGGDQ
jgi:hypothetical protein